MKASNSRFSHRPAARFSNLAHVQGGMITDADLTEAGQIHQARDESSADMALASGVPASGGMVALAAGVPSLRAGRVVAGGRVGHLVLNGAGGTLSQVLAQQADLPGAPALPAGPVLLYADLWDRAVLPHEDAGLTDFGLHGAVTSYRTRTVVQVKALPVPGDPSAALAAWRAGTFPFLATGTARATVAPNQAIQQAEDCDPCATSVELAQVLPNALFRAEVLEVTRDAAGLPTAVRLAWSMENAEAALPVSALADQTARDDFARPGAAYEWFNPATEAHLGILPQGGQVRPVITATLTVPAAMSPVPTHVRRWDGAGGAVLGTEGAVTVTGGGALRVTGGNLELTVNLLRLTIGTSGRQVQAGDYWLVELRRHAPEAERLHLVGSEPGGALPCGPEHRFCPLFAATGNAPAALDDTTLRRLSFPALNDLPADHVSFAPECAPLFGTASNVQQALRALCSLNAGHVAYSPPCPDWFGTTVTTVKGALDALCDLPADKIAFRPDADCTRFQGATNVAEALERLCEPDDSAMLKLALRSMMDWGVVCGLTVSKGTEPGSLLIQPGTALDRDGNLAAIPRTTLDLNSDRVVGADRVASLRDREGEVCLALRITDRNRPVFALISTAAALALREPTMDEAIRKCRSERPWLWQGETLKGLTEEKAGLLRQVNLTWTERKRLDGFTTLTAVQAAEVDEVVEGLVQDYRTLFSAEEADVITADLKRVEDEVNTRGLQGRAADQRRMTRAVAKIAVLERNEALSAALCVCRHSHTPCATELGEAALVPLACLTFAEMRRGAIEIDSVCPVCCRKQALTWRSWRYYGMSDFIERQWAEHKVKDICCEKREAPKEVDWGDILDRWRDRVPVVRPPFDPPISRLWPPRSGQFPDDRTIKVLPDTTRLRADDAKRVISGYGIDVVETLDVTAADAMDKVATLQRAETVKLDYATEPQPGDRVVLLTDGGKTVGLVTIGRGDAPLPYASRRPEAQVADLGGMRAEMEKIDAMRVEAQAAMSGIAANRTEVMAGLADLKSEVAALAAERRSIAAEVAAMRGEQTRLTGEVAAARNGLRAEMADMQTRIAGLRAERASVEAEVVALKALQAGALADVATMRTELDAARTEGRKLAVEMAGLRPLSVLASTNTVPPQVAAGLANLGAVTVADAAALTDVQLRSVVRGTGMSVADLRVTLNAARNR